MDFKTQTNSQQPQQASQPASVSRSAGAPGSNGSNGQSGVRKVVAALIGLVVLLALVVGGLMIWQSKDGGSTATGIEKDKYQALFMTNGQVYFGKLDGLGSDYANMTDVYYLQVQQSVQPSTTNPADNKSDAEQPQVSLTKLGNELHGPTDKMHISSDQILFWENLKDDSTVVKAIKEYKAKQ